MQLHFRPLTFSMIILLTIAACAQTPKNNRNINTASAASKDTTTIYRNISQATCNCSFSTMKNNKPSTSMDSCYQAILLKYTDSLKQLGFDPATPAGQLKLANEVGGNLHLNCPDLFKLMQKEYEDENARKLLFKGELVAQTKLPSGLYKIVLKNTQSKETKIFYAKNPLDESQIKKFEPGYELTIEYEIRKNKTTNKDEYFVKETGTVLSVGAVKITAQ
jgi:hypothetical protein